MKLHFNWVVLLVLATFSILAQAVSNSAFIDAPQDEKTFAFASEELAHFLSEGARLEFVNTPGAADYVFKMTLSSELEPTTFAYQCSKAGKGKIQVEFKGPDSTCVLHAMYTFLEDAGIRFEVTGPVLPEKINLAKMQGRSRLVKPAVAHRGIRFHLNFPAGEDSWPADEVVEYMKNLARMRMNSMTFHSYAGQWYTAKYGGNTVKAGNFFYNETFPIPDVEAIRNNVRNKKVFCIPEIEPYYDNADERERYAKAWLWQFMEQADRAGMAIQFSFEPQSQPLEDTIAACEDILKTYPMVDVLELITTETGGGGDPDEAKMLNTLKEKFGAGSDEDPKLAECIKDAPSSMTGVAEQIGDSINAIKVMKQRRPDIRYAVGVYAIPSKFSQMALRLMQLYVPKDVDMCFLTNYGSEGVRQRIETMYFTADDWKRTTVYGWIEFDGTLFLQQGECGSVYGLMKLLAQRQQGQVHSVLFNVWTVANNATTFRYVAIASAEDIKYPKTFYTDYARQLGIKPQANYVNAMTALDNAVVYSWDTWNIGFCWTHMWKNLWVQSYARWSLPDIEKQTSNYEYVVAELHRCLEKTKVESGRQYLSLLLNRVQCSVYHLKAIEAMWVLKPLIMKGMAADAPSTLLSENQFKDACIDPQQLTSEQRQRVQQTCDKALEYTSQYIELYAKKTVDRSSEGALVHYYYCLPQMISIIKKEYVHGKVRKEGKFDRDELFFVPLPGSAD